MLKQFILIFLLAGLVFTQTPTPEPSPTPDRSTPVTTDQGFIDDAAKAFAEVRVLRDTVEKFLNERAKTSVERTTAENLIKGLNDFLALKDRFISQYELMVATMAKMIEYQDQIIAKLMAMNNKPKGFFQKLLEGVKKVLEIAVFILIGRGIGGIWIKELRPGDLTMIKATYLNIASLENRILTLRMDEKPIRLPSILNAI